MRVGAISNSEGMDLSLGTIDGRAPWKVGRGNGDWGCGILVSVGGSSFKNSEGGATRGECGWGRKEESGGAGNDREEIGILEGEGGGEMMRGLRGRILGSHWWVL